MNAGDKRLWGIVLLVVVVAVIAGWWSVFFAGPGAPSRQPSVTSSRTLQNQENPPAVPPTAALPSIPPAPGVPARPEPGRQDATPPATAPSKI
jgi:hypothetical protein